MAFSRDPCSFSPVDRARFHSLLRQLGEVYDAQINYLENCISAHHNNHYSNDSRCETRPSSEQHENKPLAAQHLLQIASPSIVEMPDRLSLQFEPAKKRNISFHARDQEDSLHLRGSYITASTSLSTYGAWRSHGRNSKSSAERKPPEIRHGRWSVLDLIEAPPRKSQLKKSREVRLKLSAAKDEFREASEFLQYSRYENLCYRIDTWISRRSSQYVALAIALSASVFLLGVIWTLSFADVDLAWYENLFEGFWIAWTFMADPGTHADQTNQARRIIGAFIAVIGILFMAATLGMVVDVIREKMDALRQGKSKVVENGHSLILGWTEKAVSIIEELCHANESAGGGTIVVLSSRPKESIEKEFDIQFPPALRKGTRVVFRKGSPMVVTDLMKVGAPTARATIILSNDGDPDNADAETLRVMLALRTLPFKLEGHVVAEVRDVDNDPLVKLVGGEIAETLVSHDVLGRLMLMSTQNPGMAKVIEKLLGFHGDEFYMCEWPELIGVHFGSLIERFPDAVPIGIFTAKNELVLNPNSDRPMQARERILVIAEDDDTYRPEEPTRIDEGLGPSIPEEIRSPKKVLFCGWRRDIRDIVVFLDNTLEVGSEIHMISSLVPVEQRTEILMDEGLDVLALKRVSLIHHFGNPSVRRRLSVLPLAEFSSCLIFADQTFEADTMQSDSHSLATLLLLRELQQNEREKERKAAKDGAAKETSAAKLSRVVQSCPVICEVLDPRTQKTIASNQYVRRSSEFCQTNKITAQLLAMVAENRSVNVLFDELLGMHGNSIKVHPASRYVHPGEKISFWTVAKRASVSDEVLIGYVVKEDDLVVILNPPEKSEPVPWEGHDFIVIAKADLLSMNELVEDATALVQPQAKENWFKV